MSKYLIQPQSGIRIDVNKGQRIEIIDVDGGQVADFFAEIKGTHDEYVSPSVTIDCNESLKIEVGSVIYSNQYKPMFQVEMSQFFRALLLAIMLLSQQEQ